jgi:hypothetical protein
MGLSTFDEKAAVIWNALVLPAAGTGAVTLIPAQVGDVRVDTILVSNRDGIAHVIIVQVAVGAVYTIIGTVSVPAGAGTAGTPSVDILAAVLPATQVGLVLPGGDILRISMAVAIVATFDVSVTAFGGEL